MPARLNLFSPLPPLLSEIGSHTLLVARALNEVAHVTLWTPQAEVPEIPADFAVVQYDPAAMDWARLNGADAHIYNIGNNASYHRAIFDIARQAPGIIVLHDTRLQHFFARYSETPGADRAFYLDSMRRTHGPAARADAGRWLAGEETLDTLVDRYPMTAATLDQALAAVLHNPAEQAMLASQTRMPVFHLPLAFAAGPAPRRAPPGQTLRLVLFGFLGPNRRIRQVLDVIAALPDTDVRLDIYGALDEPEPIDVQIAALGLSARVVRHGYVPEPELQAALMQADLALNLRYPSMGEASASQLRIWAAGLASVVTRTGWYATLPEDAVFFVEPDRETETLAGHLAALRQDRARFQAAGQRGRAIVAAQHTPERYARDLLEVVAQVPALHARRAAIDLSRKAVRTLLALSDEGGVALSADYLGTAIGGLS